MSKIRIGIIGCGSIASKYHVPLYHENQHVELAAFYDRNIERAQALATKYGGKVVNSFEEITESSEIDAISDCSSNETHHIVSISALLHSTHVIMRKADGDRST